MGKQKYYYNTETCKFEKVKKTKKEHKNGTYLGDSLVSRGSLSKDYIPLMCQIAVF